MTLTYTKTTYTLRQKDGKFCWLRDGDNVPLSPVFDSPECAVQYSISMPMMTVEEWGVSVPFDPGINPAELKGFTEGDTDENGVFWAYAK